MKPIEKKSANDHLILAMLHNSIARNFLQYVRHEVHGETKDFINRLIKRSEANELDTISRMTNEANREKFKKEIRMGDTLQISYINMQILEMDQPKRDLVEKLINLIHKGEEINIETTL